MSAKAYQRTSTGNFITTPAIIDHVLVTAPTDLSKISFYDSETTSTADRIAYIEVAANTSDVCLFGVRVEKGLYMVVDAGTTPRVYAYIK